MLYIYTIIYYICVYIYIYIHYNILYMCIYIHINTSKNIYQSKFK